MRMRDNNLAFWWSFPGTTYYHRFCLPTRLFVAGGPASIFFKPWSSWNLLAYLSLLRAWLFLYIGWFWNVLKKRLTQGEANHLCFLWKVWLDDQCHFWQHHQGSHSPSWSCRPSCPSRTPPYCQRISSSPYASCPCREPSSYSSGTQCSSLSHQEVDLLELELSQIFAFHADTASRPCDVGWILDVVHQLAASHQSLKLCHVEHPVWQQSDCTQTDHVVRRRFWIVVSWNALGSCTTQHPAGAEWDEY